MSLTINGTTFAPFLSAFTGNRTTPLAGNYFASDSRDPFGAPPVEGAPMYDDKLITFPGVMSIGRKRLRFLGRPIHCDLIIVGANVAAAASSAASVLSSFSQLQRYAISLPDGVSRADCAYTKATEEKWFSIGTASCVGIGCDFLQLKES